MVAAAALSAAPAMAAIFEVTEPTWGRDFTSPHVLKPNSFIWAIEQANSTPGFDTILLKTNVDAGNAAFLPFTNSIAKITDSVSINGQGHIFSANPSFIDRSGNVVTKYNPQEYNKNLDVLTEQAKHFAFVEDNVPIVDIRNLVVDGLASFLEVGKNVGANLTNTVIKNSVNYGIHKRPNLVAFEGSTLTLDRVVMENINTFFELQQFAEYGWDGVISGIDATVRMVKSKIDLRASQVWGALKLQGGLANIVSSEILGKGLSVDDNNAGMIHTTLNFVNSILSLPYGGESADSRIQALNGAEANIIASTIQLDALDIGHRPPSADCPELYLCNGVPLTAYNKASINLLSSAISVLRTDREGIKAPYSNHWQPSYLPTLPDGTFTADAYSYVKPVATQDAASLRALFNQPGLITDGNPYPLDPNYPYSYLPLPDGAYPLVPGPLLAVVPGADTINQLINPIDGSVITTDVYGNPRTTNGFRDIGAVQTPVPGPLPLWGCGAAFGWSRRLRQRVRQGGA